MMWRSDSVNRTVVDLSLSFLIALSFYNPMGCASLPRSNEVSWRRQLKRLSKGNAEGAIRARTPVGRDHRRLWSTYSVGIFMERLSKQRKQRIFRRICGEHS